MKRSLYAVGLIIILLAGACTKHHSIDKDVIRQLLLSDTMNKPVSNVLFECKQEEGLITHNFKGTYLQAVEMLNKHFDQIDQLRTSEHTQDYLKCALVADFIYSSFSYQFLGPGAGLSALPESIENWETMPLEKCYETGNTNTRAVWCHDRALFFKRLINELLGIEAELVFNKKLHVFPLTIIGGKKYVIDPFDPFVLLDENGNIADYETFASIKGKHCRGIRTKKIFGQGGELISANFLKRIKSLYPQMDNCGALTAYLNNNKSMLLENIDTCSYETFNNKRILHRTSDSLNPCILKPVKENNPVMNPAHLLKFYLGFNCN